MAARGRPHYLTLIAAAGLCCLSGCFGKSENPIYFPYNFFHTGDIIPTHAKPRGPGYYDNFDPYAVRLEVRPVQAVNPVRTQHVLLATVYDKDGPDARPRRNRRIEWLIEGVGDIVEVDESGWHPGRGYKVDSKSAVSYTNYFEHRITRGNTDPSDDFVVRPGQSWCVITSAREGDTHIKVYAPGIYNWDRRVAFVTCRWVDANWAFPPPATARAGTQHIFVTRVFKHTDQQPLANYRVRYRIIEGPPAVLIDPRGAGRTQEAVAVTDLSGNAEMAVTQLAPTPGINRIEIEIIRPPDPTAPSGSGIVLAKAFTTIEWLAPQVALNYIGPATAGLTEEIPYTISVSNTGKIESRGLTINSVIPEGVRVVRTEPPAVLDGRNLIWLKGVLAPGETYSVQAVYQALRPGPLSSSASVVTEEGIRDQKSALTQVTEPRLKVSMTGPNTAIVNTPFTYDVVVSNAGTGPATNVKLDAFLGPGLEHESKTNPTNSLGTLAAGESRSVPLTLTPRQSGQLTTRIVCVADGGLRDEVSASITVQQPALGVSLTGPQRRYVERPVEWNIRVFNPGDVPVTNVVVRDRLPAELTFRNASDKGQFSADEVVWNVGTLAPRTQRVLQLTTVAGKTPTRVINTVTATADGNLRQESQASLDILGAAGLRVEAIDVGDPVEVGKQVAYQIEVTNTGSVPASGIQLVCRLPVQLQPRVANGPGFATTKGQEITFARVPDLGPGQTHRYVIEALALRPGDVRFRVEMTSAGMPQTVIEEESTSIIENLNLQP